MANKKIPLRKCVACNEMKEKKEMIRVIKTPENEIMLDATGRKNGRGAYICADPGCLRLARKKKTVKSLSTAPVLRALPSPNCSSLTVSNM